MPDETTNAPTEPVLRPADPDDLARALAFALKFSGRKRNYQADGLMADITADRLVKYLSESGFVVMRKPPGVQPRAPDYHTKA